MDIRSIADLEAIRLRIHGSAQLKAINQNCFKSYLPGLKTGTMTTVLLRLDPLYLSHRHVGRGTLTGGTIKQARSQN